MPRKKSYTREGAILKARDAFWRFGYENLGVRALGDATGVNRFALQTEFEGKQGLFLEVLEYYAKHAEVHFVEPMKQGGLNAIKVFFQDLTTQQENDPRDYGCLMVNTVVENTGIENQHIKYMTDQHYERMLNGFQTALENARSAGELKPEINPKTAAEYLLSNAMGIQVFVRMKGSVVSATALGQLVLSTIEGWGMQSTK